MVKLLYFIITLWHTKVWFPFTAYLLKRTWGRPIAHIIRLFFGSLVILRIIAPEQGEIPCLIHIFLRSKEKYPIRFSRRIKYLLKFWRS